MRPAIAILAVVAALASGAQAVAFDEPGWEPARDLVATRQGDPGKAVPLGDGSFAVMTRQYVGPDGSYAPYGIGLSDVAADGSSGAVPVGNATYESSDIASDPGGDVRVAWESVNTDGNAELFTVARPHGGSLGAPVAVPDGGADAREVAVAMNAAGASAIAYTNASAATVAVIFVGPDGSAGAPVTVAQMPQSDVISSFAYQVEVHLSDGGEATVAWVEMHQQLTCQSNPDGSRQCNGYSSDYVVRAAHGTAGGFGQPATVATFASNGTQPTLALGGDAAGGAAIAWLGDDQHVHLAIRTPGAEFGAPFDLGEAGAGPDVSVARSGRLLVAYPAHVSGSGLALATVASGSTRDGTISAPVAGPRVNGNVRVPSASFDDPAVVVWTEDVAVRGVWIAADGSRSPVRDVACLPGQALAGDPVVSGANALALLYSYERSELLFALARPDVVPGTLACPRPTPPVLGPSGPFLIQDYRIYRNRRPGSAALLTPPASDAHQRLPAEWSDGGSDHATFSQDNRNARLVAFDSAATNLVAGDTNGHRDVFVFRRAHGPGNLVGRLVAASVSSRGRSANGDSEKPSLDGATDTAPHCVAFQSRATNLTASDRDSDWDVYLRDLRSHMTMLLSPGVHDAENAVVDGRCRTVTFDAGGSVWVTPVATGRPLRLARGDDSDQQTNGAGAAYERGGQVWYRSFALDRHGRRLHLSRGRERLVSATPGGRPGNGRSANPALDDTGAYVAFESTATNLCGTVCVGVERDTNGPVSDVFRRTLSRHAPTHDRMEMADYSIASRSQLPWGSHNPVISAAGENIVFEAEDPNAGFATTANIAAADKRELYTWSFPRARGAGNVRRVPRRCFVYLCSLGPTARPAISSRGNYLAFTSLETEFCAREVRIVGGRPNCPAFTDVFIQYIGPSHEGLPLG